MKKLAYVNSLRGLAILAVIMLHTSEHGERNPLGLIGKILNNGASGVQLFFVASAFTLFLSFKHRQGQADGSVWKFYYRRIVRIAPLYYLGIVYYLFQDGTGPRYWLGDGTGITSGNILSNIFFIHGINPYWVNSLVPGGWSITAEMTFYVIAPFLFTQIKDINTAFAGFLISLILSTVLTQLLRPLQPISSVRLWSDYLYFYFPNQLPVFMLGIILYFIQFEKQEIRSIKGYLLLLFAGIVLLQLSFDNAFFMQKHVLFGAGFVVLAIGLSQHPTKIIVNPILNYIGTISFSMYLSHFAVLYWLDRFELVDFVQNPYLNYGLRFLVTILLSIAVSAMLYNIVELPTQKWGRRLIDQKAS